MRPCQGAPNLRTSSKINVVQFYMHCKPKAIRGGTVASTLRSRDVSKKRSKAKRGEVRKSADYTSPRRKVHWHVVLFIVSMCIYRRIESYLLCQQSSCADTGINSRRWDLALWERASVFVNSDRSIADSLGRRTQWRASLSGGGGR